MNHIADRQGKNTKRQHDDLTHVLIDRLTQRLGPAAILSDPADCLAYGVDNSRRMNQPLAVVLPSHEEEVAIAVRTLRELKRGAQGHGERPALSLTPRGRGTGTTGAAVPNANGVVISFERMRQIIEVDPDNRWLVAQPGVTNAEVQTAAHEHGLFWPPDPTSSAFCTIGGNIAHNSAGPHAVKYGTTRDNTLGLRAVTGAGDIIRTGVHTTKGVVGYDLTRLLIGSEGTLALTTEATLRLSPKPAATRLLLARFTSVSGASQAIIRIMRQPVTPSTLEFMDQAAVRLMRDPGGVGIPAAVNALLMIEVDGTPETLDAAAAAITAAAQGPDCHDVLAAKSTIERDEIWAVRKALSPTLRSIAPKKINEDIAVPVAQIATLTARLDDMATRHRIRIAAFGHAGNGNLHVNLLIDPDDADEAQRAEDCLAELFRVVLELRGTLSGEHGVGLAKRAYIGAELDPTSVRLMYELKRVFDPDGLLNPDKTLP
ncbi:MAG: FAD-binding oxidoreductase [Thioalkalivibrionaceae bacterium]